MKHSKIQGEDGIITEGQKQPAKKNDDARNFKGIYLRALAILYHRAPKNHGIRPLIKAYINVQVNALIDLSSRGDQYGVMWHGPMDEGYTHGQMTALDALAGYISVNYS